MHLVIVDTAQIQPYIFGSNRLRENIGASHLVAEATETWAFQAVRDVARHHNIRPDDTLDDSQCIATSVQDSTARLDAEVLYAGGGNFVVLFSDLPGTREFTSRLSRRVLQDAPNLQLVIVQKPCVWSEPLAQQLALTFQLLAQTKRSRVPSAPLLGLGVTVMCRSTGLPATGVTRPIGDDPGYPAGAEIHAKLAVADSWGGHPSDADERLRRRLPPPDTYEYPGDFDDLGGSEGEHRYIAIVHADGNGMGQRMIDLGKEYPTADDNRQYITALRHFSDAVQAASLTALNTTLACLAGALARDGGTQIVLRNTRGDIVTHMALKRSRSGRYSLPFRPLVFGGDDVTFVCDGRLGLALAVHYLRAFEQQTALQLACRGRITACAGIAMVKTHYPFARAYELADALCRSAKDYRRTLNHDGSYFDWHFAQSGLAGDIKQIRAREYTVCNGSLTLRPVSLDDHPVSAQRTWPTVQRGITGFRGDDWAGRHNKVKALRDALRNGGTSVRHFLTQFNKGKSLPTVTPARPDWASTGWHGGVCGYFDALELVDWYIPLEGVEADEVGTTPATQK